MDMHTKRVLYGPKKLSFEKCHFTTEWLFFLILFIFIGQIYYCSYGNFYLKKVVMSHLINLAQMRIHWRLSEW